MHINDIQEEERKQMTSHRKLFLQPSIALTALAYTTMNQLKYTTNFQYVKICRVNNREHVTDTMWRHNKEITP